MIKSKYFLLLSFFFLSHLNSFCQDNVSSYEVDLLEKTPKSPNAGGLGKYFSIPVNMAIGLPNISIPIYTIKTGNITVPISLSYHAGGVQVNDIAGSVGLNWSLVAGGSVVKRTNGLDDYYATSGAGSVPTQNYTSPDYSGIPYNPGYTNMTEAVNGRINVTYSNRDSLDHFFSAVALGRLDGEADEYIYNMPEGNGKFYYNQANSNYQTNTIDGSIVTGDMNGWTLTAKDGKVYGFNRPELTVNPAFLKYLSYQEFLTTTWYLSSINDPSTSKQVNFYYDNYYKSNVDMGNTQTHDYTFIFGTLVSFGTNYYDNFRSGDNYVIGSISFDQGVIYFIKDTTTRTDYGPNAIKQIKVYNNNGLLLKQFDLDYFYSSSRLFLNSLQETEYDESGNSRTIPSYRFTYDTASHLPARLSYAQDFWGFYNGKTSNTSSIPSHPLAGTYSVLIDADRRVDSNYTRACMLNGIVYPIGGKTSFEFENNRIGTDSLVGGVRIKKITHFDSVAQKSLITEYKYVMPGTNNSSGEVSNRPVFNYDLQHVTGDAYAGLYFDPIWRTESTPVNPLFPNQGSSIFYYLVEKREKGSDGDLMSRHFFSEFNEAGETYESSLNVPHPKQLEVKDIIEAVTENYSRVNDSTYTLIQKDSSGYNQLTKPQNYIWNAQAAWTFTEEAWSEWPGGDPTTLYPMPFYFTPSIHAYKVMPCVDIKTDQYAITVANGTQLTIPSFYDYDTTNGNVKSIKTEDSKGDTTIRMIKYAADFSYSGAGSGANHEIDALLDSNMLASPVEILTLLKKKDSTNSIIENAILYEYENRTIKKVYRIYDPVAYNSFTQCSDDASGFYKDSHYTLHQEITAFDSEKNPKTVITNTNKESYVWGTNSKMPIAIVANALYADVAATSFELDGDGGWTIGSTSRDTTQSVTGNRSYDLNYSSGSISKSGLTSGTTYIVSYWSKNGSYSVSGSTGTTTGKTINGWTYYQHTVTGVSSVTVAKISGTSMIDELRIYPKDALMNTFTYVPGIGMKDHCDTDNRINYYEYYGPDQLKLIKDQDKNVIKAFDYKYQQTQNQ